MDEPLRWIDRVWSFAFPEGIHPQILARLRGTPARLEEAVRDVPQAILVRRVNASWSIQEHAGHLLDLEPLFERRLEEYLAGADRLSPADPSNRQTWEAEYNLRPLGELLAAFRRARRAIVARLETLGVEEFRRSALHPRLALPVRLIDLCYLAAEHDDHHLAWIHKRAAPRSGPLPSRV